MNTLVCWARKHTARAVCLLIVLIWLAQTIVDMLPRTSWAFMVFCVMILTVIAFALWFAVIYYRQIHTRQTLIRADRFIYYCPACYREWFEDQLPRKGMCPHDHLVLKAKDMVEDEHCHPL